MTNLEIFQSLSQCATEAKVADCLANNAYTADPKNWIPLGNNKNNAAMVQNTAGTLGSCMTELTTNAIDAVISREKNEYEDSGQVIPESALKSPSDFLKFILGEDYTDKSKLNVYANNKIRMLTNQNTDRKRMLTIIDHGCGQQAKNFGDTFCSVGSGQTNKAHKPWLHGNYGQGSTSANAISGKLGLKLIVSRENVSQMWGFTIIRRAEDRSMLEYLVCGDTVLEFEADKLELAYRVTGQLAEGEACLEYGSAIKLYDVNFESGFVGIKRTMASVLFRPALPVKSIEFSESNEKGGKPNGRDSRWIFGLGNQLDKMVAEGRTELQEFSINVPELGTAYGRLYFTRDEAHNKEILEWLPSDYKDRNKRIFHTNNGQAQHFDSNTKIKRIYPKAFNNIFIEIDLSFFNSNMAKAYLWKADRTSFQTSSECYQNYDQALEKFFERSEIMQKWDIMSKNDQMAKLKGLPNDKAHDVTKTVTDYLAGDRESKQYKATRKMLETEQGMLSNNAHGKLTLVNGQDENKVEVVGKEIPTMLSSTHNTKASAKKSTVNKISGKLKTDAKKGSVSSKSSNSNIKIKEAFSQDKDGNKTELDIRGMNVFVSEDDNNNITFDIDHNKEIKSQIKVGDFLTIKISLTTQKDNEIFILEEVVFYEIVEELREVKPKKSKSSTLKDLVILSYATRDGRVYQGKTTGTLDEESEKFTHKASYFVAHDSGQIRLCVNVDNKEYQLKLSKIKDDNDKIKFNRMWESFMLMEVFAAYQQFVEDKRTDIETLMDEINDPKVTPGRTRFHINSVGFAMQQEESHTQKASKYLDKLAA